MVPMRPHERVLHGTDRRLCRSAVRDAPSPTRRGEDDRRVEARASPRRPRHEWSHRRRRSQLHGDAGAAGDVLHDQRLGYTAYYPLPEAFFADPAAYNEAPIGNGPFMMDGSWEHDIEIRTVANPDFAGEDQAQIEGLTFQPLRRRRGRHQRPAGRQPRHRRFSSRRSGWPRWRPRCPTSPSRRARRSTSGHSRSTTRSTRTRMSGRPCRWRSTGRHWSTARSSTGPGQPAFNLQSPVIPGCQATVCDNWNYDPEQAAALWESSGGIDGPITVWFNSGAGHDAWVEAVVNMWTETLGIDPASVSFESLSSPTICRCSTTRGSPVRSASAGVWTSPTRRTTGSRCWTAGPSSLRAGGFEHVLLREPRVRRQVRRGQC